MHPHGSFFFGELQDGERFVHPFAADNIHDQAHFARGHGNAFQFSYCFHFYFVSAQVLHFAGAEATAGASGMGDA
jgi:hypothetical protein